MFQHLEAVFQHLEDLTLVFVLIALMERLLSLTLDLYEDRYRQESIVQGNIPPLIMKQNKVMNGKF